MYVIAVISPILGGRMNLSEHPKLQKAIQFIYRCIVGLCAIFIGAMFIGLLIVGPPEPPVRENFANVLITLGLFISAGLTIYTFRGGCRKK